MQEKPKEKETRIKDSDGDDRCWPGTWQKSFAVQSTVLSIRICKFLTVLHNFTCKEHHRNFPFVKRKSDREWIYWIRTLVTQRSNSNAQSLTFFRVYISQLKHMVFVCSLFYLVLYRSLFVLPCTCTFHWYLHLTISYVTEAFSLSWSLAVTWRTEVPCWNKVSYKNLLLNGTALRQHNATVGTRTAHQAVGSWYSLFKALLKLPRSY